MPLLLLLLLLSELCRFEGQFTAADSLSSYCGQFTDSTGEECVSGRFDLKVRR